MKYSAVAAFVPVTAGGLDEKRGETEAALFTTSYFFADADPMTRPVCFVFNGGPGASSGLVPLRAPGPAGVGGSPGGAAPPPPPTGVAKQEEWFGDLHPPLIDSPP